ncbi:uncharacterized protein F5147DRAFT_652281 [Suillus discolor]|uniref:Uncharacterized protein n=1 Tax=Suillus discolor TaxID=1912936 RepID=A0A9P7JUV2_9AGAM|nr:uncharacterized protein F5147DRAFT_652281 [Suillus discolor]KAG2109690.1 hypothetical protein F5147DRAFT_652281 [Suillus discolor]
MDDREGAVKPYSNSNSSELVDDARDVEPRSCTGILGVRVIEILKKTVLLRDLLDEIGLMGLLHLNETLKSEGFSLKRCSQRFNAQDIVCVIFVRKVLEFGHAPSIPGFLKRESMLGASQSKFVEMMKEWTAEKRSERREGFTQRNNTLHGERVNMCTRDWCNIAHVRNPNPITCMLSMTYFGPHTTEDTGEAELM